MHVCALMWISMCICVCVSSYRHAYAHSEARPLWNQPLPCGRDVSVTWVSADHVVFRCSAGSSAFLAKDQEGIAWAGVAACSAVVPHSCGFSSWTLFARRALKEPARSKPAGSV